MRNEDGPCWTGQGHNILFLISRKSLDRAVSKGHQSTAVVAVRRRIEGGGRDGYGKATPVMTGLKMDKS